MHATCMTQGPGFLAVIGLYETPAWDSVAFQTLHSMASRLEPKCENLTILLYDNTPSAKRPDAMPPDVFYFNAGHNGGLAEAFNYGLEFAHRRSCTWLITLDQDTVLPPNFLKRISEIAHTLNCDPSVAAIVPQLWGEEERLSPYWFWAGAIPRWYPPGFVGVPDHPTFAFNSGSVLRVAALRQIGGYNPWFWLDNSDAVLYHQLHRYGKKVFVAGDIRLDHHFSMLDKKARMTLSRYHNVLMAESAFWDLAMSRLAGMERTGRLIGRWCKQTIQGDGATFGKETAHALKRRLFHSRKSRLELWKRELLVLQPSLGNPEKVERVSDRPRISVCMATYNGHAFITEQLTSVLEQLGPNDEVVVVDDCSEDQTKNVIVEFSDPRILLLEHQHRHGVVKTFEHAIRAASGDILFLSDQDDLWAPEKVSKVMSVFRDLPDVTLVASGVQTIDESGNKIHDDTYSKPRHFSSGLIQNLISNRFQGATMALRSNLIPEILPFPDRPNVLHDAWIGIRNTLAGGTSCYIDDPLLLYRRHSKNASRPLGFFHRILKRAHLVLALIARWYTDSSHSRWSSWDQDHHVAARFGDCVKIAGISLPLEENQQTLVGGDFE